MAAMVINYVYTILAFVILYCHGASWIAASDFRACMSQVYFERRLNGWVANTSLLNSNKAVKYFNQS